MTIVKMRDNVDIAKSNDSERRLTTTEERKILIDTPTQSALAKSNVENINPDPNVINSVDPTTVS